MSKEYKIKVQDIFDHTNGGLDIIRTYISDIDNYVGKNRHFKLRQDEETASASIKLMKDGNYVVTDFGGGIRASYNGLAIIQYFEKCTFGEAVSIAAERHHIPNAQQYGKLFDSAFKQTDAKPDQQDGERDFHPAEETPKEWLEIIFSRAVFREIEYRLKHIAESEREEEVLSTLRKLLVEQHWHPIEYYTTVKDRKFNTITSSTYYPIFMIEEEGKDGQRFKKIYQPRARAKKNRFFYHGKFDNQFLHGYMQVRKKYDELMKDYDPEDEESKEPKLDNIIYCTGGSDALNFYALGYDVVYPSSEHFKLNSKMLRKLFNMADRVLTCPDLDSTGQLANFQLCMNPLSELYLDISTIDLPAALQKHKDQYGRPCKDLRDFLNHYTARDLSGYVRIAKKYKFWDYHLGTDRNGNPKIKFNKPVYEYRLSSERVLYFLENNGFYRHEVSEEVYEYVHIKDNVVTRVNPEDIKSFVIEFLRQRFQPEELINIAHRSPVINDSLFATLPMRKLDFRDHDFQTQYMFFENATWEITANEIKQLKPAQSPRLVWNTKILPYRVRKQEQMFTVTKDPADRYSIDIHNQDCMFFRFLIQTSRIHWRKELEYNLADLSPEEADKYRQENKFNIAGPNLTDQERNDQVMHLLNKMYAFGYLMHRYKSPSRAWIVVLMDDTPNRDGQSHGGTGKSIFFNAISRVKNRLFLDGKDTKLFEDNHVFEQIDKNTDLIYIDDCDERFPFTRIFSMTTGDVTKNPKGRTRTTIMFEDAPKFGFSTNFAPDDLSESTLRRILFAGMSNYYHNNSKGDFNEKRQPTDDFGKELFTQFTDDEWTTTFNFMAQCCQFYLQNQNTMINAPMDNIMERSLINEIGLNFLHWAEEFFAESRLDSMVFTSIAQQDYIRTSGVKMLTTQGFNSRIRSYARLKGYKLNPKELCQADGRAVKNYDTIEFDTRNKKYFKPGGKRTQSFIYLQSESNTVTTNIFDPVLEQEAENKLDDGMPPIPAGQPVDF